MDKGAGSEPLAHRNIGVLAKAYRLCCKMRALLQEWRTSRNRTWSRGSGAGKGAEDAAWMGPFEAEGALASVASCAEVLSDSEKCYECYERIQLRGVSWDGGTEWRSHSARLRGRRS